MGTDMPKYHMDRVLGDGLVLLDHQLWVECKMRKEHTCSQCEAQIDQREKAYRPLGNPMNRQERICLACIVAMAARAGIIKPDRPERTD
jgi:hypothetical protein